MLLVIREETNVLFARGDKLSGSKPRDCTVVVNHHFGLILFQTSSKTLSGAVKPKYSEILIHNGVVFHISIDVAKDLFLLLSVCFSLPVCLSVYLSLRLSVCLPLPGP